MVDAIDSASNQILTEMLLLDRGAGNFDVLFAYGSASFGIDGAPATGTQLIQRGNNSNSLLGPFSSINDFGFSFNGGTCATCTGTGGNTGGGGDGGGSVSVAEPSSLSLIFAGMFLLVFSRRRRGAST